MDITKLIEEIFDGILLTLFVYLIITLIWQWLEKKVKGKRTYVAWHDVAAILFSVVIAVTLSIYKEAPAIELIIGLISLAAQIIIFIVVWKSIVELIELRKINKLLEKQIEVKNDHIETQGRIIDKLYEIAKTEKENNL
ncbi:hypothetical protein K0O13_08045 [Mammaliicoccus sciuri]|uniref:hypothetical protein n=1 Tax=Mammaliicoccus sciuri TaxID=1296 RepID=UPI001C6267E9|nr:hypothetical protein [Mammaliicoccus sciuri]QYG30051.1 hypothetical protein K0O13_08045 [Mammaliicoccus sciuri]